VPLVRETSQRDPRLPHVHDKRARSIKHVDVLMQCEVSVWEAGSFVVSRHNEDWHPSLGDSAQRFERLVCETRRHTRPIEYIAAVHHDIHLAGQRGRQRDRVVGKKIVSPPTPLYARLYR